MVTQFGSRFKEVNEFTITVTFPVPFATTPVVVLSAALPQNGQATGATETVLAVSPEGFTSNSANQLIWINWIAVAEG